ncbi:MAG TPA: hypothetical protein VL243_10990 [Vicinamibacterales bacterium]|nr:hypothetical protein [Vicinamibacterales bacterium]
MSPVISVNVPDYEQGTERQTGAKPGTVGHPIPGVVVKIVDRTRANTRRRAARDYCWSKVRISCSAISASPEKTAEVLRDGWYITGDIACIDDEGFIQSGRNTRSTGKAGV